MDACQPVLGRERAAADNDPIPGRFLQAQDVDDPEAGQWRARLEAEQRVDGAVRVLQVVIGVDQHDAIDRSCCRGRS